jgi:Trk-type K+ transport system membrane component
MSLQDDADTVALWRLTAEQRRQIYEEEKSRIEKASPEFSKRTKIIAAIYLLGCLLLYFGISTAVMEFWSTRTWTLKPESQIFLTHSSKQPLH